MLRGEASLHIVYIAPFYYRAKLFHIAKVYCSTRHHSIYGAVLTEPIRETVQYRVRFERTIRLWRRFERTIRLWWRGYSPYAGKSQYQKAVIWRGWLWLLHC